MRTIRNFLMAGLAGLLLAPAAQAATSASAPNFAPIALNSLSSPPDKIATAKVVDDGGTVVGAVQKVDLDANGKPTKVEIALLGSDRIVALDSSSLSYDQSNNVVTAGLDKGQIAQLPPAQG
jgi:hypothetical protein